MTYAGSPWLFLTTHLRSQIGKPFVKNSYGITLKYEIDRSSVRALESALRDYPPNVTRKVMRIAVTAWARKVAVTMKTHVWRNAHHTRRAVIAKVLTFKNALWAGVGVATGKRAPGKRVEGNYGDFLPGWRAHFYENGWRAFIPNGTSYAGKGRAWRKGVRGAGGPKRYARQFMAKAHATHRGGLRDELAKAIGTYNKRMATKAARKS